MFSEVYLLFSKFDQHLLDYVERHGAWSYGVMFLVLACEVGLVVTPFIPGETLLFAAGALAAKDGLHLPTLLMGFSIATFLGSLSGYSIGRVVGWRLGEKRRIPFIGAERFAKLKHFFNQSPSYAVIYTRFLPIVRALTPFVAGTVAMSFNTFAIYSAIGGVLWVLVCTFIGYLFGHLPVVKENFSLAVIAVVVLLSVPACGSALIQRWQAKSKN